MRLLLQPAAIRAAAGDDQPHAGMVAGHGGKRPEQEVETLLFHHPPEAHDESLERQLDRPGVVFGQLYAVEDHLPGSGGKPEAGGGVVEHELRAPGHRRRPAQPKAQGEAQRHRVLEDVGIIHDRLTLERHHQWHPSEPAQGGGVGAVDAEALDVDHIGPEPTARPQQGCQRRRPLRREASQGPEPGRWQRHGEAPDPYPLHVGLRCTSWRKWRPHLDLVAGQRQVAGQVAAQLLHPADHGQVGARHKGDPHRRPSRAQNLTAIVATRRLMTGSRASFSP